MFNRTPYNRAPYNRKARFVFEWTATANVESGSGGAVLIIRYLSGEAEAGTGSSGEVVRVLLPSGTAEAVTEAVGDYIRTRFFAAVAEAVTTASGTGVSTYGQEVLTVAGVNMVAGDELIIDTEHMTVTLNGVNIVDRVSDASALANVNKTHDELLAGRFRSKGFYEFDLVERGKPRHIRSVHISERVVQRCLCDYSLVPMLSRTFIYDNGASLRGKGYDFAVRRVSGFLTKHYRQHGREGYVLVFDFSKYFDTAQHGPVFREIEKSGLDDRLVSISEYFIKCFGDVGLGLGSQVSQIAAIALPNKIDHFVKDVLRMKFYERYMDDGCIIHRSKKKLRECLEHIKRLCAELGIKLNEKKTQIIKLSRGFTFLKVRFRYGKNGAVIRRACYKSIKHMRDKLKVFRRWVDSGRMAKEDVDTSVTSFRGHMRRFNDYFAVQTVEREYRELFAA